MSPTSLTASTTSSTSTSTLKPSGTLTEEQSAETETIPHWEGDTPLPTDEDMWTTMGDIERADTTIALSPDITPSDFKTGNGTIFVTDKRAIWSASTSTMEFTEFFHLNSSDSNWIWDLTFDAEGQTLYWIVNFKDVGSSSSIMRSPAVNSRAEVVFKYHGFDLFSIALTASLRRLFYSVKDKIGYILLDNMNQDELFVTASSDPNFLEVEEKTG
ncbi:uncharacterized protein [Diadema antillarum]|uniref:uncharacterized protein n=1 Tax=Diadema antillarum TaxID=105358 RepID=UPI003A874FEA